MRRALIVAVLAGAATTLLGCDDGDEPARTAESAGPITRSDCRPSSPDLTITPSSAAPGTFFTVDYPTRKLRLEDLTMSPLDGKGCRAAYLLYYDGDNFHHDDQDYSWSAISGRRFSIAGSPRRLSSVRGVVPTDAAPGAYQVCGTGGPVGTRPKCTTLVVTD